MKKSAIKDIFNGVRGNIEAMEIPEEDEQSTAIVNNIYKELKEKLSPELLSLHQKLVDALGVNWSEEIDFYFAEGFKLGVLVGIECMEQ